MAYKLQYTFLQDVLETQNANGLGEFMKKNQLRANNVLCFLKVMFERLYFFLRVRKGLVLGTERNGKQELPSLF